MAGSTHSTTAGNSAATQMDSGTAGVRNPMCQSPCTAVGQDRITSPGLVSVQIHAVDHDLDLVARGGAVG